MHRSHLQRFSILLSLFAAVLVILAPAHSHAQALPTAGKVGDISVFGGYNTGNSDYGKNGGNGITLGGDFTRYLRLPIVPSLEVRGSYFKADQVTEKTIMGGFKGALKLHSRFHPYADIFVGLGEITFTPSPYPGYTGDRSLDIAFGGGIDVDVVHNFALKVDYQLESWNLGKNPEEKPQGGDFTLSPTSLTVGIQYTIPFRAHNRQPGLY